MNVAKRQDGLSLVEMLVVLSLVGMVLAISLPYARTSGDRQRLVAEANMLAARLREARSLAISSKKPHFVTIDLEARVVVDSIVRPPMALAVADEVTLTTADNLIVDRQGAVRFFPDGGSTGGTITLSLGQISRTVAINWLTGAVVVRDGEDK